MGIACTACLHFSECMERRGKCKEYKDLEEVRKDIAMLNQKARATKRTDTNKANSRRHKGGTPGSGALATGGGRDTKAPEENSKRNEDSAEVLR